MDASLPPPLLIAEQLSVGYRHGRRSYPVAERLECRAAPGQLIALLGPNGCGKSTLLRSLAGMQPLLGGRILLGGQPLEHLRAAQRATRLAVVLTEAPDANLTVYDLIATGRYPHTSWLGRRGAGDERAVGEALRQTSTQGFAHRSVGTLSDGERQRVMIARALAQDTPLLILDEPTAHLDVPNRVAVLQLLLRLAHDHHKTVLLSTHALELVMLMADQLWLMHGGRLISGTPEDLALRGALNRVFDGAGVAFDRHTGTFGIERPLGNSIGLEGSEPEVFWTRRALERGGYSMVSGGDDIPQVRVTDTSPARWRVSLKGNTVTVDSVAAVLECLANVQGGATADRQY